MELPKRKRNRLRDFDYSGNGAYFITICTDNRKCMLSSIVGGGVLDAPKTQLTAYGRIVEKQILAMNEAYPHLSVEKYTIMPNHIHLLILISCVDGTPEAVSPANQCIPRFVSTLKRFCNAEYGKNIWQRSYHDHIIRCEADYRKIWEYIDTNPAKWREDCFYCEECD